MQIKTHWESATPSPHSEWKSLRKQLTNAGKDAKGSSWVLRAEGQQSSHCGSLYRGSQKARNRCAMWPSSATAWNLLKGLQVSASERHLHVSICCSCTHSSWTVGPTPVPSSRGVVKENVVWCTHWNRSSSKKEWGCIVWKKIDGTKCDHIKCNNSVLSKY